MTKANTEETATTTTTSETAEKIEVPQEEPLDKNTFLAFARVYSGTVKVGQKIYVLGPRHDPNLFVGQVVLIE